MKRNDRIPRSCLVIAGVLVGPSALWAAVDPLPASSVDAQWPEMPTVQELLRLDAKAALQAENEKWQARGSVRPAATLPAGRVRRAAQANEPPARLIALYGVGDTLAAEILMGGKRVHFDLSEKPGRSAGAPKATVLPSASPGCVVLRRGPARHRLCLPSAVASTTP